MEHDPAGINRGAGVQLPAAHNGFFRFPQGGDGAGKTFGRHKAPEEDILFRALDVCPGTHGAEAGHLGVFG